MKKMLITGASGFIGKNLIDAFCEEYDITAIYRNHSIDQYQNVKYVRSDLSNNATGISKEISDDYNVILHFSGQVQNASAVDYIDNSLIATRNVINMAKERHVDTFVLASSIATYGYTEIEVNEESDRLNPTLYGMSKTICERMVEESGLNYVILRLPRVLGSGMDYSYPWLPLLAKRLINNEEIRYFNPGLLYNNLLDINDLTGFIKTILSRASELRTTLTLGCRDKMPVMEIVNFLKEHLKSNSVLSEVEKKPNTVFAIDITKAINYGFSPMTVEKALYKLIGYANRDLL